MTVDTLSKTENMRINKLNSSDSFSASSSAFAGHEGDIVYT